MIHHRPFSWDPDTGIQRDFYYDPVTDEVTITAKQYLDDIMEDNKGQFRLFDERSRWSDGLLGNHVARIPMMLVEKHGLARDPDKLRSFLNNSEESVWRTRPGRV